MKVKTVIWVIRLSGIVIAAVAYAVLNYAGGLAVVRNPSPEIFSNELVLNIVGGVLILASVRMWVFGLKLWKRAVIAPLLSLFGIPLILILPSIMALLEHGPGPEFGVALTWTFIEFVIPCAVVSVILAVIPFCDYRVKAVPG